MKLVAKLWRQTFVGAYWLVSLWSSASFAASMIKLGGLKPLRRQCQQRGKSRIADQASYKDPCPRFMTVFSDDDATMSFTNALSTVLFSRYFHHYRGPNAPAIWDIISQDPFCRLELSLMWIHWTSVIARSWREVLIFFDWVDMVQRHSEHNLLCAFPAARTLQ